MQGFIKLKYIVSVLVVFVMISGGYMGYLSALVDIDEITFLEKVEAATDKQLLEKQLARAQSILDARSRAYIRRSLKFVLDSQADKAAELGLDKDVDLFQPKAVQPMAETVAEMKRAIEIIKGDPSDLSPQEQTELIALQEEQSDLDFFEDEVDTIEQMLARGVDEDELDLLLAEIKERRRLSGSLRQLLLLLDKRKEISQQRDAAKKMYNFWETNPRSAPGGVDIIVRNKGLVERELSPLHVTQISTAFAVMPQGFDERIRTLYIVYGDAKMRRGMSGVGVLFMKGEETDFFRVLVHEMGHIWDLHREVASGDKSEFYDGQYRLFEHDPSVSFYRNSWKNAHERAGVKDDFASSYGYTDPFEDFAEVFALYVLQGDTFRSWIRSNQVLSQKYSFLADAFNSRTFDSSGSYLTRPYDVTMMAVNYDELLNL